MLANDTIGFTGPASFRQLRLFEAIGDLKSVRRASEECSLSQPAVTQSLAKLESQLGMPLVDRRATGSYLNELGEIFHSRVQRFFQQMEDAVVEVRASPISARAIVNRLTQSQTRALVGTVEHGTCERAAEKIGVSFASLQRAARDLESNLHVSLWYRTAHGAPLNPQGLQFGRRVKLALQEIRLGLEELASARGGASQRIVIGAMPLGGSVLLAAVLDDFLQRHPRCDVVIKNENAAEMAASLLAGDVDLMIGLLPPPHLLGIEREALAQTPCSIVARRGHPLTRMGKASIEDLAKYNWIVGTDGSGRRAAFDNLFAGREKPNAQAATCSLVMVRALLEQSDRLTLLTSYELQHEHEKLRAVPHGPILPVPSIGISTRANWMPTKLHADFLDAVRAYVAASPVRALHSQAG